RNHRLHRGSPETGFRRDLLGDATVRDGVGGAPAAVKPAPAAAHARRWDPGTGVRRLPALPPCLQCSPLIGPPRASGCGEKGSRGEPGAGPLLYSARGPGDLPLRRQPWEGCPGLATSRKPEDLPVSALFGTSRPGTRAGRSTRLRVQALPSL